MSETSFKIGIVSNFLAIRTFTNLRSFLLALVLSNFSVLPQLAKILFFLYEWLIVLNLMRTITKTMPQYYFFYLKFIKKQNYLGDY